jgi:hypothetical protein
MADPAPRPLDAQEPTTSLPPELFDELASLLADALVASYRRAQAPDVASGEAEAP